MVKWCDTGEVRQVGGNHQGEVVRASRAWELLTDTENSARVDSLL